MLKVNVTRQAGQTDRMAVNTPCHWRLVIQSSCGLERVAHSFGEVQVKVDVHDVVISADKWADSIKPYVL
jgi:hypothetical protein